MSSTRTIRLDGDDPPTEGTDTTDTTGADTGTDAPFTAEREPRRPEFRRMETELAQFYSTIGVGAGMFGGNAGNFAGQLVARRSGELASSWIDLAERDIRIKRAIQSLLQGGAWSGVIFAHVGVALPIAAYLGVIPEQMSQMVWVGLAAQDPEFYAWAQQEGARQQAAAAAATAARDGVGTP